MPNAAFIALVACLSFGSQAGPKPTHQGPDVRRVCVKNLDVHLGDSFEEVSKHVSIRPDPNGPNQNSDWVAGRNTDFMSTQGPEYRFADGTGVLRSVVSCTFDDRKRLTDFRLNWSLEGEHTEKSRDAVLRVLIGEIHTCLDKARGASAKNRHVARIDFGTYSQELVFDDADASHWQIVYTLSEEP